LPGGVNDKLDPFLSSYFFNLEQIIGYQYTKRLRSEGKIKLIPMSYLRGVTFRNSIVILDEAQNATKEEVKLFLTRLGEGSKFIIAGDIDQSDLKQKSGLKDAIIRFQDIKGIGIVEFDDSEVVRHPLIKEILIRYGKES